MALNVVTRTQSATTTQSALQNLPLKCTSVLFSCPSANTDFVEVIFDGTQAEGGIKIRPGQSKSYSIAEELLVKIAAGYGVFESDYFRGYSFKSESGTQTIDVEGIGIQ